MRLSLLSWSFLVLLVSAGCGKVQVDLGETPSVTSAIPQSLESKGEFISSAQKKHITANGFVIDSAVGSVLSQTQTETANGYKVFSTIQGQLQSDETVYR